MASLSYATGGTAPIYGGIGWIAYGTFTLAPGASQTGITGTLKDGSTITFNISNAAGSAITVRGATLSGYNFTTGYSGTSGNVVLYANASNTGVTTITFSSIVVKDPLGVTIPNYTMYLADGEITGTNESITGITDGGNWFLYTTIGSGVSPTLSGTGSSRIVYTGTSFASYNCPVCGTLNPTSLTFVLNEGGSPGLEGIVVGISILKVKVGKYITNRFDSTDQFSLNISGSYSATTTTYGSTYGAQPLYSYIYPSTSGNFIISESMAAGSSSSLTQYNQTISYTNLTAGGTAVPSSNTIPHTLTINAQDVIIATITNSLIPPTISTPKSVDKQYETVNGILTYTIPITNNSSVTITQVVFIDTIPTGSSIIPNSLFIDGSLVSGSPSPPGVTIPDIKAGSTSTISFKVQIASTIPSPNVIINSSTTSFHFYALPTTLTEGTNSNQVATTINYVTLSASKTTTPINVDCGSTITYTILIINYGSTSANNIIFHDTIPIQSQFIANSFTVDGVTIPGQNPNVGINIGSIGAGGRKTLTFQTRVVC